MTETASTQAKPAIASLTGIRALAAFLVLFLHADQNIPIGLSHIGAVSRGYLGVDLFFLLSGFILTYVYFDSMERPTGRKFAIFMWHRFIRLYPVHIAVLAALVIIVLSAGRLGLNLRSPEAFTFGALPWQLLLVHAWGVTDQMSWNVPSWSISAEWFAYLCFPLVAYGLGRVRDPRMLLVIAVASLGAAALIFSLAGWGLSGAWIAPSALVRIAGSFVCGAALCRYAVLRRKLESRSALNDAAAMMAIAAFLVLPSFGVPDFALIALLAVFIAALAMSSGVTARLFSLAPMVWLGEISYSLYMVHFPVLRALGIVFKPERLAAMGPMTAIAVYAFAICVCVAAAAVLYYLVERPLRVRLRNVIGEMPRGAATASAIAAKSA
ncbi:MULTISPECIES: acyltransferase [unclassified Afipia]|uniref:acyltransferase family protein n=1 Tax=unclassified Afipia TaxID=2642050 RepID=UPI00041983B7|nr:MULTISPECIES: acyltransferase [unclassified Afipia]